MRATTLLAALLPLASAHFSLNYPPDRGDNGGTQSDAPCGGLNTPSSTRTSWPISGGQLSFEAGHDEAKTAVYLALGNNPKKEDFTIIVVDTFIQIGLGTFCWNSLELPRNLSITDGQNATIQVVQQGHDDGGLYNCADITFTEASVRTQACSNSSGITAEAAATGTQTSSSTPSASRAGASASASAGASAGGSGANTLKLSGGAVVAGVVGLAAWLL